MFAVQGLRDVGVWGAELTARISVLMFLEGHQKVIKVTKISEVQALQP